MDKQCYSEVCIMDPKPSLANYSHYFNSSQVLKNLVFISTYICDKWLFKTEPFENARGCQAWQIFSEIGKYFCRQQPGEPVYWFTEHHLCQKMSDGRTDDVMSGVLCPDAGCGTGPVPAYLHPRPGTVPCYPGPPRYMLDSGLWSRDVS